MNEFIKVLIERLEEDIKHTFDGCINKRYAIEIVNQLAEEHNNDFCEWEADDKEIDVYYTKCGQAHIFVDGNPEENNHVFCPYCGKKIKTAPYQPKGE